jgi:hypothetical protein
LEDCSEQLLEIITSGHQEPLGSHLGVSSKSELAEAGGVFDLPDATRYPIIIQQKYWLSTVAPHIEGYAIAQDFFFPDVPRLFGVKLASTMPGYAFAVYLPNQFDSTRGQAGRSSVSATDSEPWHQAK